MAAVAGRAEFAALKGEAARLKEENERLESRGKQLEKEIQQLKARGAQAQAKDVPVRQVGPFHLYLAQFPGPMDPAALRACADAIRRSDPEPIIFLCDAQGFCVATSGGTAQRQGILANELLRIATQAAGGSGGGRADLAQGRLRDLSRFPEVEKEMDQYIRERSK